MPDTTPRLMTRSNRFERHPVIALLGAIALCIVFLELLLRFIHPQPLEFAHHFRQPYRYSKNWLADFKPSTSALIRFDSKNGLPILNFLLTINEYGFRGPDRELDRNVSCIASGDTIIHAIGDSMTMGWGVNYEASYPAQLDFLLDARTHVLNLGLNAFGTIAATEKSLALWDRFPAKYVVYLFHSNDFDDDRKAVRNANRPALYHQGMMLIDFFRHTTYLAGLPFAVVWWWYYRDGYYHIALSDLNPRKTLYAGSQSTLSLIEPSPEHACNGITNPSTEALLRYKNFLDQNQARLIVLTHESNEPAHQMYCFCRQHGIEVYPLQTTPDMYLIKEGHFNQLGNERVARFVHALLLHKAH